MLDLIEVISMLSKSDRCTLNKFMQSNPEISNIIKQLEKEYQYNMSKFSHEIRNPIALINSSLQLIESQHPEVKGFSFWNDTLQDLQYVRKLLDELSDFNKSSAIVIEPYNINELIASICSSVICDCLCSSNSFTVECQSELPIINGDPIKIRQVITNLIKNAKEAVNPKTGIITLKVFLKNSEYIEIQVTDNGKGIDDEYKNSLFDPFVTHKVNGSGLGLAISKSIIEAHQGSISYNSELGVGTTFYILLPINPRYS